MICINIVNYFKSVLHFHHMKNQNGEAKHPPNFDEFVNDEKNHFMIKMLIDVPMYNIDKNDTLQMELIKKILKHQYIQTSLST